MKNNIVSAIISLVICLAGTLLRCTLAPIAGGTEDVNTRVVVGAVYDTASNPAPNTVVTLVPENYDPIADASADSLPTATTDVHGQYRLTTQSKGNFSIQAVQTTSNTRLLILNIAITADTTSVPDGILRQPGAIRVMLPGGLDHINGYLYIPGTTLFTWLADASGSAIIDAVPAGTVPSIVYKVLRSSIKNTLSANITVFSNSTPTVWPAWRYSKQLVLNTTASGADVAGTVTNFPVLVRLNAAYFDFSQTQPGGADLRFTKTDGTPLPCEVERWDAGAQAAEVWVRVDSVYGNDSSRSISMYWGNPDAVGASNGAAVFDSAAGFLSVWHLSQAGNTIAYDATANHFDGVPYNMNTSSGVPGVIGNAQHFDGSSSYIRMPNTSSGKLNFAENGVYSISAWVYADSITNRFHLIVGKGHDQYSLKLTLNASQSGEKWEIVDYLDGTGWQLCEDTAARAGVWTCVTGVRSGNRQYLYVNGVLVDSTISLTGGSIPRNTSEDVTIGRYLRYITYLGNEGYSTFNGRIDEVRIMDVALDRNWIRLCYMNQQSFDRLVSFRAEK